MTTKTTIAGRISRRIAIFTGVFFVVILLVIYNKVSDINIENAIKSTKYAVQAGSKSINAQIVEIEVATKNLAWQVKEYKDNRKRIERSLKTFVKENDNIFGCTIAPVPDLDHNLEKNAICAYIDTTANKITISSLFDKEYDYLMTNWYLLPKLLKHPVWTEPYFDEGNINDVITTYSFPVKDNDDNVICIIAAHITLDWLEEVSDGIHLFPNSTTTIMSKGGVFIYSPKIYGWDEETLFSGAIMLEDTALVNRARLLLNNESDEIHFSAEEIKSLPDDNYYISRRLDNGWYMSITTPYDDILGSNRIMVGYLGVIAIIGLTFLFYFLRRIIKEETRSIKDFAEAARKIATGDFNVELPDIRTKDETYSLRESMEYMQKELAKLEETKAKKQSYESELAIARHMQESMIPSVFPHHNTFDAFGNIDPAKEIGGDLFGFLQKKDKLFFYIGDVSGKGIPAALYMSFAVSTLHLVIEYSTDLGVGIRHVNDYLCKNNNTLTFITLFVGCVDLSSGQMEYCNCGHNPIVVISPEGDACFLKAKPNVALGVMDGFDFKTESLEMLHGTRLVLYTDGVTEAERKDFVQFEENRLIEWANNVDPSMSSKDVAESLKECVNRFTEGNIQNDDMTILTLKLD